MTHVMPTPWCFDPGSHVSGATCSDGSALMYSCPDSTVWPNPAIPCHATVAVAPPAPTVPHAGAGIPWGGLDLVVVGVALLAAAWRRR